MRKVGMIAMVARQELHPQDSDPGRRDDKGYFKATAKFRRGGKAAKGSVRFAFKTTVGTGCGTDSVRWRAGI